MRLTVLSSGPHSPAALHALVGHNTNNDTPRDDVICVTNSTTDVSLVGLRFCPDLDAAVRVLTPPDAVDGAAARAAGAFRIGAATVLDVLRAEGLAPAGHWTFDDVDAAHAIARVYRMGLGADAVECARAQSAQTGVTILPLTPQPVELHVIEEGADGERRSRHAARWTADPRRARPQGFAVVGMEQAGVTPGVLDAIRTAERVVLPPMSPILESAGFLAAPGVRDALRGTGARVVVMSPVALNSGHPDGVEAATWPLTGQEPGSPALARLYADFADVLLIDESEPAARYPSSLTVTRAPLRAALSGDVEAAAVLREAVRG